MIKNAFSLIIGVLASIFLANSAFAAIYQWSAPVGGDDRRMLLWIPENCKRIRGLIWAADNLSESNIVESTALRKVCEEERIGIIRSISDYSGHKENLRPALSANWGWLGGLSKEDSKEYVRCQKELLRPDNEVPQAEKAAMQEKLHKWNLELALRCEGELNNILKKMADVSGYPEIEHAPLLFMGHSMCGLLCWNGPFWIPDRVWGSLPVKTGARGTPPDEKPELRMDGVPLLYFNQIPVEGTLNGRVPSNPDCGIETGRKNGYLVGRVFDWGGTHFDMNDGIIDVIAMFVKKASKERLSDEIPDGAYPKLKNLTQEMGWLAPPVTADSKIPGAPYAEYQGDKTKACWFFDKEMADKAALHFIEHRLKKRQGITVASDGRVIQPYTGTFGAASVPMDSAIDDGWTFRLTGEHLDYFTGEYPADKQTAGVPKGGKSEVKLLGRTNMAKIGDNLYRYRRYNAGGAGHGWFVITHTGDAEYARMAYACGIWFPDSVRKGTPQKITFPDIPNVIVGASDIELKATSDVPGQVVEYYVVSGPAELEGSDPKYTGSTLHMTPVPPHAKFPVKVIVAAYQMGRLKEPLVQSAKEVVKEFYVCNSEKQLAEVNANIPPPPTYADVSYGPEPGQKLDFWQSKSDKPTPLIMNIHGGGWLHGPREPFARGDRNYLNQGISVAHITYTFTSDKPLPAPVHDAARALQFLRSKASEWNIDPSRVIVTGGSAGGCSALWLATHDDLANPKSTDPVERESTRVSGAIVASAQTSIEPNLVREWVGQEGIDHGMVRTAGGFKTNDEMFKAVAEKPEMAQLYREFSPINHLTPDDPPILLGYSKAEMGAGGLHGGAFGLKFKEKAEAVGMTRCYLKIDNDPAYPGFPGGENVFVKEVFKLPDKQR